MLLTSQFHLLHLPLECLVLLIPGLLLVNQDASGVPDHFALVFGGLSPLDEFALVMGSQEKVGTNDLLVVFGRRVVEAAGVAVIDGVLEGAHSFVVPVHIVLTGLAADGNSSTVADEEVVHDGSITGES